MNPIEVAYCDYCKFNDASLAKLAEYASPSCPDSIKSFLENCRKELMGKTGAWDLGSLIVKPVQRVLKYPLLIRELLKTTSPDHPDYDGLVLASNGIGIVAEKINELKKRVDIVEKYVGGKGHTNVMHGISKKLNRSAQQFKKATGLAESETVDDLYESLIEKFELLFKSLHQLKADVLLWIKTFKDHFELEESFAAGLVEVYFLEAAAAIRTKSSPGNDYPSLVKKYFKTQARMIGGPWKDADTRIKSVILPALDKVAGRFKEPQLLMKKHDAKMLDAERLKALKAKGEEPDKLLEESADAFEAIHTQLVQELPLFMNLVSECVLHIVGSFYDIQMQLHVDVKNTLLPIAETLLNPTESVNDIIPKFMDKWRAGGHIERATSEFQLLTEWHKTVWDSQGNYQVSESSMRSSVAEEPLKAPILLSRKRREGSTSHSSVHLKEGTSNSSVHLKERTSNSSIHLKEDSLINLEGSMSAPKLILPQVDSDAVLRNMVLVSHNKTLTPERSDRSFPRSASQSLSNSPKVDRLPRSVSHQSTRSSDIFDDKQAIEPNLLSVMSSPYGGSFESMPDLTENRRIRDILPTLPFHAVSIYPFEAEYYDEIHLLPGSDVLVLRVGGRDQVTGDDWWFGRILDSRLTSGGGRLEGWFPGSYVLPNE